MPTGDIEQPRPRRISVAMGVRDYRGLRDGAVRESVEESI
jgi:hypothetical protein